MVANYTASKKPRKSDDYTPGGVNNRRPDRACMVYTNLIRRHFKNTRPIMLGGIEASLRRVAHYDYWSNKIRGSILFDAKADYLIYGMGETPVGRARIYLSRFYNNPNLMLQDVAGEVGMSQSHFSTVFAQETGITFTQYLTGLRIAKAKELLAATDMRSSEIAFQVGYNDAHYFSYLFKKNIGMTPGEYRSRHQK
jgi:AraC-like DNA-binding protein